MLIRTAQYLWIISPYILEHLKYYIYHFCLSLWMKQQEPQKKSVQLKCPKRRPGQAVSDCQSFGVRKVQRAAWCSPDWASWLGHKLTAVLCSREPQVWGDKHESLTNSKSERGFPYIQMFEAYTSEHLKAAFSPANPAAVATVWQE